jgi:hypothetical protein
MDTPLIIFPTGAKTWRLTYTNPPDGKTKTISLGEYPVVGLAAAREKALALKVLSASGVDPVDHRRQVATSKK